ncbi:MAG: type IV pilus assembly protein PilM [Clostridiaceae bacterium]|nr:type IV pilus assembly protein PilM [Clostridiaceae bacterium]
MFVPKTIALEIGSCNTKIAQVKVSGSKIYVDRFAMIPTPPGTVDDGRIMDIPVMAENIMEVLRTKKMRKKNAVITISGTSVITREVIMPKVKPKELHKMIMMESVQYFPVNIDNYVLDYKVLEEITNVKSSQYRVLLVAVPVAIIEGYVQLAEACGLKVLSIDFAGNSIVKFMKNELMYDSKKEKKENEGAVAILDIGCKTTTVSILSKGIFQFNRILHYGSQDFTNMIAKNLDISFEKADKLKIKKANIMYYDTELGIPELVSVSKSIRTVLIDIVDDLSRFFDFYRSRSTGNRIDRIYLVGGGSLIKGLDEYFEETFNIATERISEFNTVLYRGSYVEFYEVQPFFANCLGAVLKK